MSRIRSIHPGLWTDEAFVELSPLARLLFIGMWNECDDKGTFAWSPLKLKMRVLPADNADPVALLAEIEAQGLIRRYQFCEKPFGAVRNFCKHQRPKKPNDIHPASADILLFAGMNAEQAELMAVVVPNQFPTGGEKASQMEDGGGNRSSEADASGAVPPPQPSAIDFQKAVFDSGKALLKAAYGHDDRQAGSALGRLRKQANDDALVLSLIAQCEGKSISDPIPWLMAGIQREKTRNDRSPACNDEIANPYAREVARRQAERAAAEFG